jgi:WD40 repeat protein/DNA-directed RNA polymerase subunit RPC12/RpoP
MLIACFQCRQQLDVPEDSAGKRVHCPHCQYVIVVPAKLRATVADSLTIGLPSMDLDGEAEKTPTTKIPAQPLPPLEPSMPAAEKAEKAEPASRQHPPEDEEAMPSIERGRNRHRRAPMSPAPPSNVGWGKILGGGSVIGVIVIAALIGAFSSRGNRGHQVQPPIAFNPPPLPPQIEFKKFQNLEINPGFQFQNLQPMVDAALWRDYQNLERRFKVQFPGQPREGNQNVNLAPMTTFDAGPIDWEFSVAHRTLSDEEYRSIPLKQRFASLQQHLGNVHNAALTREQNLMIAGSQPGREWDLILPQGNMLFVRTYFVQEGKKYHHYLLQARGPVNVLRFHADINRFFNSFSVTITDGTGQSIFEELDDPRIGGRRDNEFTAMAIHPKESICVVGSQAGRLKAARSDGALLNKPAIPDGEKLDITLADGKPAEQLGISQDGRFLAVAAGGAVQVWSDWTADMPEKKRTVPGIRFAFTKDHDLLVASRDDIREYQIDRKMWGSTLKIPDLTVAGFALSSDGRLLAVFGDKAIELWHWQEKKLLGRIEAHGAAITAVVFSPDGKTIASASADRTIKLWDVENRTERASLKEHAWTVWALAFTPDGKHLASGGLDGMLLLWDVEPEQPKLVWAQSHQFPVRAVAFDADGKHCFATCKHPAPPGNPGAKQYLRQLHQIACADMKLNEQEAKRIVAQQAGLHLPTSSMMTYLTPDAHTIVTTTDAIDGFRQENSLRVWDAATAKLKYTHSMKGNGVLSPDGKWLAFDKPGMFNQLHLLEVQTNRVIAATMPVVGPNFPQVMFTPDSESLWVRRNDDFIRYEIQTPKNGAVKLMWRQQLKLKNPNDPRFATITPALDHKTFMVERISADGVLRTRTLHASADGAELQLKAGPGELSQFLNLKHGIAQLELHDLLNGSSQVIGQQRHAMAAIAINKRNISIYALDPKQKFAATTEVSNEQAIRIHLWDVQERRPVLTLADPRTRTATALRFSPDGRHLALVTGDSWTRIVPMDWLLERKDRLPCDANEVTGR